MDPDRGIELQQHQEKGMEKQGLWVLGTPVLPGPHEGSPTLCAVTGFAQSMQTSVSCPQEPENTNSTECSSIRNIAHEIREDVFHEGQPSLVPRCPSKSPEAGHMIPPHPLTGSLVLSSIAGLTKHSRDMDNTMSPLLAPIPHSLPEETVCPILREATSSVVAPVTPNRGKGTDQTACCEQTQDTSRLGHSQKATAENVSTRLEGPITPDKDESIQARYCRGCPSEGENQEAALVNTSTKDNIRNDSILRLINQGDELNTEGPRPKRKRKKHRPKVIEEGNTTGTHEPAAPSRGAKAESHTVKRTYVRKKKSLKSLDSPSGAFREVGDKSSSSKDTSADPHSENVIKSAKRRISFEPEKQTDGHAELAAVNDAGIAEKSEDAGASTRSSSKSAVLVVQGCQVEVESSPAGLVLDLTQSANKVLDDYLSLPEELSPISGCFSRAVLKENLKHLARKQGSVKNTSNIDCTRPSKSWISLEERNTSSLTGMISAQRISSDQELKDYFHLDGTKIHGADKTRTQTHSIHVGEVYKRRTQKQQEWRHGQSNPKQFSPAGSQGLIMMNNWQTPEGMVSHYQGGRIRKKRSIPAHKSSVIATDHLPDKLLPTHCGSPQTYKDAMLAGTPTNIITKKRTKYRRVRSLGVPSANVQNERYVLAKNSSSNKSTRPTIFQENLPCLKMSFVEDVEEPSYAIPNRRATTRLIDPMEEILWKLRALDINSQTVHATTKPQNALVLYGDRTIIPYESSYILNKQRHRAKVNLDDETDRVWKLLMGKDVSEPGEGVDVDRAKWWQKEREVFQGRANSFIARMRLVQGDRHFSPWKGSVVDSVVGVFLTQNVADHLSSSAFISLAARFPAQSDGNITTQCTEKMSTWEVQQRVSIIAIDETSIEATTFNSKVHQQDSLMTHDNEHKYKVEASTNDLDRANSTGMMVNELDRSLQGHPVTEIGHGTQKYKMHTQELTGNANSDLWSQEDVPSSRSCVTSDTNEQLLPRIELSSVTHQVPRNGGSTFDIFSEKEMHNRDNNNHSLGDSSNAIDENTTEKDEKGGRTYDVQIHEVASWSRIYTSNSNLDWSQDSIESTSYDFGNSTISVPVSMHTKNENANGSFDQPQHVRIESCVYSTSSHLDNSTKSILMNTNNNAVFKSDSDMSFAAYTNKTSSKTGNANCRYSSESTSISAAMSHQESRADLKGELKASNQMHEFKEQESSSNSSCNRVEPFYNGTRPNANGENSTSQEVPAETSVYKLKAKKSKTATKMDDFDWDSLRKQAYNRGYTKERTIETIDTLDWEAVRRAEVDEVSQAIRERGMNNVLAGRIKDFLNRLVKDHGSIDLEWLREIPPQKAKDYLLSVRGLGLKSVECVRLLTLQHVAFPVDTNVGRICVRLGWVPLQPLPESLQLHLLELYPVQATIQKYLWPRLCKLDQRTLYELHYQMITFGKVFCTKNKPNCNACPMRSECKHFASAFASARLALPAPEDKSIVGSRNPLASQNDNSLNFMPEALLEGCNYSGRALCNHNSEPIIEEPESPKEENLENLVGDIEDIFYEDPEEIPTIKLNMEAFAQNIEDCIRESKELQTEDIAKALVTITTEAASIPVPKLKNVTRLRTEHHVYELPDSHPLLKRLELDQREPDDPCPYLLILRMSDETMQPCEPPKSCCHSRFISRLYNNEMCHICSSEQENPARNALGTILVPCRTAMRGKFPLNGTYFQVNEVFADHYSSHNPIVVPREQLWNLRRRIVYFGTSVPTIFRGLTTEEIQHCFWKGFVCVRGFDLVTRAPRPLCPQLHLAASKTLRNKAQAKKEH